MIGYAMPDSRTVIVFERQALDRFRRWRQRWPWSREAGGQLFAKEDGDFARIVEATGPRPGDVRLRSTFAPDRDAERREIVRLHEEGLHFVGDWHTHPQDVPRPSPRDLASMNDLFGRSDHRLNAMLLVVVGRTTPPCGLFVGLCDGTGVLELPAASPESHRNSSQSPGYHIKGAGAAKEE